MKKIAIITARGGSKRIPKKNIKLFLGKPIISYSIKAALDSNVFDEVMVSTDDEEIANISRQYSATIPFMRSKKNSSDYATTADVIVEVLQCYKELGQVFDVVTCIYPAAPFVTSSKLKTAVNMLIDTEADALMPVVQYSYPPQRSVLIHEGRVFFQQPQFKLTRSQDLEPIYHDCGQFYVLNVKSFDKYRELVMPKTIPYIMPEGQVQDIDNVSDWELAELKFQAFNEKD